MSEIAYGQKDKSKQVMEKPFHVFCCYAREDKKYLLLLKKHLKPLERRGSIVVQDDIDASPGEEWEKKISQYLNTAHIILLLISPNFMDSDYCYSKEMKRAIERHELGEACVVPIILQPVNWQGMPFSKLQALPTDGVAVTSRKWRSRDEAFHDIAKGIETAIEGANLSTDQAKFGVVPPLFTVFDLPLSFVKRQEEMQASQEKAVYEAIHTGEHSSHIYDISTVSSSTPAIYARPFLVPPLPVQSVIGRDKILADISTRLALFDATATEISPIALRGMGGVGKTTLALALGRQEGIRTSFPDGVLWVEIGPRPLLRQLLHDWGRALGVDLIPERDEKACSQRLRDILSERQVLIIVDDVWEEEHGSIFQIAGPRCRLLFTTRESVVAHALATRARTIRVDVLNPDDALTLLGNLVPEAVNNDQKIARRLCEKLEFLPLALKLAGQFLANEADVPHRMHRLADELAEQRASRLSLQQRGGRKGLGEDTVSLRDILGLSVQRLNTLDRERFAYLSVFGGEPRTWGIEAAAHVWESSRDEAEQTTAHLIQRGLVEPRFGVGERYWMHALFADYADDLLENLKA